MFSRWNPAGVYKKPSVGKDILLCGHHHPDDQEKFEHRWYIAGFFVLKSS
jgi:hypothetical protein